MKAGPNTHALSGTSTPDLGYPRFAANSALLPGEDAHPRSAQRRAWTGKELSFLMCEFLRRENPILSRCHGLRAEADWLPLARALAIRLAADPTLSLASSSRKAIFLLREQIGAWLIQIALDRANASRVRIHLPSEWNDTDVLAYVFRHDIAPMDKVASMLRTERPPLPPGHLPKGKGLQTA